MSYANYSPKEVEMLDEDHRESATGEKVNLSELLKNCRSNQLHDEADFGNDVGREIVS